MADRAVAVVGGGLTGLAAALAIGRTGRPTHLIDPDEGREDHRTTAMLGPTIAFLAQLGVWDAIEERTAPLRTMRIIDGSRRLLRAPTVTFEASEIGRAEFGRNVPNAAAASALREAIADCAAITVHRSRLAGVRHGDRVTLTLEDGAEVEAALVVGADGRGSIVRAAANIDARRWDYPQAAIVTTFAHEVPHRDLSTEFHTEAGPATQVPLPGDRSSLVWVTTPREAERMAAMDAAELSPLVEERLAHILGRVEVDGPVQRFPMSSTLASDYAGHRTMLVGEAAHAFPPIGAQGFNLSMRDVMDAAGMQRDAADPGAAEIVAGYRGLRGRDAQLRTLGVDALNRSLLSGLLPVQAAKAIGLAALRALPPLRQAAMREGFEPGRTSRQGIGMALGNAIGRRLQSLEQPRFMRRPAQAAAEITAPRR